jgi:CheY-like chemotaxis protein
MARIGLLEDNIRIAKLSATMLNYSGHDVTIYSDAYECLQSLAVIDAYGQLMPFMQTVSSVSMLPIDVLILDLHLPTMTGLEALRLLMTHPRTYGLPLVFCTAATMSEINGAFALAPQAMLVEKPFKLQSLISAISTVLPASV